MPGYTIITTFPYISMMPPQCTHKAVGFGVPFKITAWASGDTTCNVVPSTGEVLVKLSASFLRMWDEAIDMTWLWTCRNCWQGRARSIQILVDSCKSLSTGRLVSWCQLPWPRSSLGRNIAASGGTSNLAESRGKPVREWDTGSHSRLRIDMAHGKTWQNKFYKHWIA